MPSNFKDLEQYADHLQRIAIKLDKAHKHMETARAMFADLQDIQRQTKVKG